MFKKLVTNLPYSPGLLKQISFYSRRLKKEEFTRRLGVIFVTLAMLLNINLVFFSPEASVLASPGNDVVSGGVYGSSASEIQTNTINAIRSSPTTRAIFDYYDITEEDIRGTTLTTINTGDKSFRSVGRQSFGRGEEACRTHNGVYFCERSMHAAYRYKSINVRALVGLRESKVGSSDPWFAVIESCGNVVIRTGGDEQISLEKKLVPNQERLVQANDEVVYRLNIKSHNNNGAKDPVIVDTLPKDTQYVSHYPRDIFDRVSVNGNKVTLSSSRGEGIGPNSEYNLDITVKVLSSAQDNQKLCNAAQITSQSDSAVNTSDPCVTVEEPIIECRVLNLISFNKHSLTQTFEVKAFNENTPIKGYKVTFGDGNQEVKTTTSTSTRFQHTYDSYGDYTAKAYVQGEDGFTKETSSCVVPVNITPPPVVLEPTIECVYLNAVQLSRDEVEFIVKGNTENGGQISSFRIEIDNIENPISVANDGDDEVNVKYTFENPGEYQAVAFVESPSIEKTSSDCEKLIIIEDEPCPYDETIFKGDENCQETGEPHIAQFKYASNLTREIADAHNTIAGAGDIIEYKLVAENDGGETMEGFVIREALTDVLQYATIHNAGGGELINENQAKVMVWPAEDIKAGERLVKKFSVKIKNPIPNTPVANSDQRAFDLMLENVYGNNVTIKLPSSTPKSIERVSSELPETGPAENLAVTSIVFAVVVYFYARNRMINKELAMIKTEFSGGVV